MTLLELDTRSGNGRVLIAWRRSNTGSSATVTIQVTLDYQGLSGWTTVGSGLAATPQNFDYTASNSQTVPMWFRASDDGGATWVYSGWGTTVATLADYAYCTATDFIAPDGFRVLPVGTSKKTIYVAPAAATPAGVNNSSNSGLSPEQPRLDWNTSGTGGQRVVDLFNPGDHIAFKNNSSHLGNQQFNYSPNTVSWPASSTTVLTSYGPIANTRPTFTGNGNGVVPVNMQATNTNISFWLQNLDFVADISARHTSFIGGTSNENGWQGVQMFCGGSSTSCGTNWGVTNCHFKNWFFALDVEGEKVGAGNTGGNGRINGFKFERSFVERCFGHAVSSDHGIGGPQSPSGWLFHCIDGLTVDGSALDYNGFDPSAGNIPTNGSGSGATVFYGPAGTSTGGTATVINTSTTLVALRWIGGTMRFTSGANNGQTRAITTNAAGTITVGVAFGNAPSNGDTYTIDAVVDTGAAWVTSPTSTTFAPTGRFISATAGGFTMYRRVTSNTATLCAIQDGWVRGTEGAIPSDTTAYNIPWSIDSSNRHNCYCQESSSACTVNNTISRGNDFMLRPGGVVTRFLSIQSPIGLSIKGNYLIGNASPTTQTTSVTDSFFDGPREKDDINTGGTGIWFGDANNNNNPSLTVTRTIIQNKALESITANGGNLIRVDNDSGTTFTTGSISVVDSAAIGSNQCFTVTNPARITSGTISLTRSVLNQFRQINSFDRVVWFQVNGTPSGGIVGSGMTYWSVHGLGSDDWFQNGGSVRTRAQWTSDTGDSSPTYLSGQPAWTNEYRTTDYVSFLTSGGQTTVNYFMSQVLANRRGAWDPHYTAEYAISYMRQGYSNLITALTPLVADLATSGTITMVGSGVTLGVTTAFGMSGSMTLTGSAALGMTTSLGAVAGSMVLYSGPNLTSTGGSGGGGGSTAFFIVGRHKRKR